MRFAAITTAITLLSSAQAFVLPEGAKDGVYMVTRNPDGTDVHTKMTSAHAARSIAERHDANPSLERRLQGEIWCGCTFTTNPSDTDAAVADIKNQLGGGLGSNIKGQQSFYSIRGSVVAFVCNRFTAPQSADRYDFEDAAAAITNACGRYIAGAQDAGMFGDSGSDSFGLIMGYQRYKKGEEFCKTATTSPKSHC